MNTEEKLVREFMDLGVQIGLANDAVAQARRSGYPEEAERCEERIAGLERERAAVKLAIDSLAAEENKREEETKKLARWRELVPLCRQARIERNKLARALEDARRDCLIAENAASKAEFEVTTHNRSLLGDDDYPTDEELMAQREQVAQLETALEKARGRLRAANEARTDAQMAAIRAAERFTDLAREELRYRPKSKKSDDEFRVASIA